MSSFLIAGQGIAGTVLAQTLLNNGHEVLVVDQPEEFSSSKVAAGLMNPITGRRVVKTWRADELFPFAKDFYREMEQGLGLSFLNEMPIYKPFLDIEQQNDLLGKAADERFKVYLDTAPEDKAYESFLHNEFGGVEILQGGFINTKTFLGGFRSWLMERGAFEEGRVDFNELRQEGEQVFWKERAFDYVFCCEGHHATENPYFGELPLVPNKGETLVVKIQGLPQNKILNRGFYMVPCGDECFIVGATHQNIADTTPTEEGRKRLCEKLDGLLKVPYTIIEQKAAVRPTVKDRRPLIGMHPRHSRVGIFNGLGTKGITLGPFFAKQLHDCLIFGGKLDAEVDVQRFFSVIS